MPLAKTNPARRYSLAGYELKLDAPNSNSRCFLRPSAERRRGRPVNNYKCGHSFMYYFGWARTGTLFASLNLSTL